MKAWLVIGGVAAALVLAGCGGVSGSDEYKALSTENATNAHELEQTQQTLDETTAELERLQTEADKLQEIVDGFRSQHIVDQQNLEARRDELNARAADLRQREQTVEDRAAEVQAANEEAALGQFGETGTFVVGTDMAAGGYFAAGGPDCRWAFLTGTGPNATEILANRGYVAQYVDLDEGDFFHTEGCGPWVSD